MIVGDHPIGLCSWSVHPKDMSDLVSVISWLGLQHVQLAVGELMLLDDKRKHQELGQLRAAKVRITAAMLAFPGEDYSSIDSIRRTGGFVPDEQWTLRRRLAQEAARFTAELGVRAIGAHVGFIPGPDQSGYSQARDRVWAIADDFAASGIDLLMETGQEPADELLAFLEDLRAKNVFVNFDPANMILYGAGDPIEAVRTLGRFIRHVHVKDAIASDRPGITWGEEVPFGQGQVGPQRFINALRGAGYRGPLVIEREAGKDRVADVKRAIEALQAAGQSAAAQTDQ